MWLIDTCDGVLMILYTSTSLVCDTVAILYYSIVLTAITVIVQSTCFPSSLVLQILPANFGFAWILSAIILIFLAEQYAAHLWSFVSYPRCCTGPGGKESMEDKGEQLFVFNVSYVGRISNLLLRTSVRLGTFFSRLRSLWLNGPLSWYLWWIVQRKAYRLI